MKRINEYSKEIMITYYKNTELVKFAGELIAKYPENVESGIFRSQIWTGNKYENVWHKRYFVRESASLGVNKFVNKIFDEMLVWFCKGYESDDNISSIPCDKIESIKWTKEITEEALMEGCNPEYTWEKLTINDAQDLLRGVAPRLAMLDFIWETLQYCSKEEMKEFVKMAELGKETNWTFETKNKNESKKQKVKDLKTGIIYESKDECAKSIGKSKSYISKYKDRFIKI